VRRETGDARVSGSKDEIGSRRSSRASASRGERPRRGARPTERWRRRQFARKKVQRGFFRRVTGRITTPRRVARSRSRAETYVAGGAGLHVVHLELWLGVLKFGRRVDERTLDVRAWNERACVRTRAFAIKFVQSRAARSSRNDTHFHRGF
jgi:hypothetical protein